MQFIRRAVVGWVPLRGRSISQGFAVHDDFADAPADEGAISGGMDFVGDPIAGLHHVLGPSDMDGHVLTDAFTEAGRKVESVDLVLSRQSAESFLSEDEEQQIKDKLKGWGYL